MSGKIRSCALAWADAVVEGTFFLMQNYLTDVWKLSFSDAAAFMNIWGGLYRILPIFLVFLTGERRSSLVSFIMHAVSGMFSITGLVIVTYTALPGYRCHQKGQEECIGRKGKAVFIAGMALIGVGRATRLAFSQPLIANDETQHQEQTNQHSNGPSCGSQGKICAYLRLLLVILFFVTPAVAFFAFPYVKKWYVLFGVAAMCMVLATLSHLSRFRTHKQPLSSPASVIIQEVKKLMGVTHDSSSPAVDCAPLSSRAIVIIQKFMKLLGVTHDSSSPAVDSAPPLDSEPCLVNINVVDIATLYSTWIMCGVVSSIGTTYFVQQATQMNYNIGHWKPPLQVLQLIFLAFKFTFKLYFAAGIYTEPPSHIHDAQYLAVCCTSFKALLYSVVCCAVAAAVERRRVHAVWRHDLVEQPDDVKTPMSAFWLLFQVGFLGMAEENVGYGFSILHKEVGAIQSMKRNGECLSEAVTGLGYMCSVLSVYVVGKISETRGGKGWFQPTLNASRLDRYYWVLTALSAVYLFVYIMGIVIGMRRWIKAMDTSRSVPVPRSS